MSDFGLEIEVTPSIQPGGLIQLNLGLTFEKPDGATHIDGVGDVPNTFSGRSHATLIVRDGGTLIANGLIVTIKPDHPREVPIHGRVPVATGLNSSAGRKRSAIFALVTPRVLRFQKPDEPQQTASAFTFSPGKAAE